MDFKKVFGFNKSNEAMPAHKCLLSIITMREVTNETGDKHFKFVKEENVDINGNEFRKNMNDDIKSGLNREIEVVYEKPTQFTFNKFYLLATRKRMWVWILEPTEE